MAVNDELVKQQLDQIIQTIGFGIVSDFRDLKKSMSDLSSDNNQKNVVIDQINDSVSSVDKQLKTFEKESYREKNNREFRRLEDALERRSKINMQQSDNTLAKVLATVEKLKEQVAQANKNAEAGPSGTPPPAAPPAGGGSLLGTGAALGGGTLLGGGAAPAAAAAPAASGALATAVEVGAVVGGASLVANQLKGAAAITPTSTIAPAVKEVASITEAAAAPAKATVTAGGKSAAEKAGNVVGAVMKTKTAKALEKVTAKSSSYIAKFGPKIASAIGSKNIPIFGTLVGGYFAFQRFFAGDSWTAIGAEFVSGVTTELGFLAGGPPGAVAGFAASLAIQAYLISRDIYTAENAADIQAGVVPNFDDLPAGDKKAVIVAVGAQVSSYVNSLFGASKTSDATVAKPPEPGAQTSAPSPTPAPAAAAAAAGVATASAASMAEVPSAAGGPPAPSAPVAPAPTIGGGSVPPPASPAASPASGPSGTAPAARGAAPMENESSATSAPVSDTTASFTTESDQASGISGGDYRPILDYIADSEGADYNTQYAYQNTTGGVPLTDLSVAQIMEAQSAQQGSSAIGRYQFMKQTMRDGIEAGIISPDEQFSPQTQDRLATWLIDKKRRGASWKAGQLSDSAFGKGLAQEWASVPDPSTGAGYYSGQNAKYGTTTLFDVLKTAKGVETPALAKGGTITPLPSDVPKSGANIAAQLAPVREVNSYEDSESMSSQPITTNKPASPTHEDSGNNKRNKIGAYTDIMSHVFGTLTDEFKKHSLGEVSADHHFERAMHPLG